MRSIARGGGERVEITLSTLRAIFHRVLLNARIFHAIVGVQNGSDGFCLVISARIYSRVSRDW